MPDILHRIEVRSSAKDTYQALATTQGLTSWWTDGTQGTSELGGVLQFRFGTLGGFDMKVLELDPGKRVLWQVVGGPSEWIGTRVSFELTHKDDATAVLFKHQDWKEPTEFMHHCSTKWATFLMSMKALLETGQGAPYPKDAHITVHAD